MLLHAARVYFIHTTHSPWNFNILRGKRSVIKPLLALILLALFSNYWKNVCINIYNCVVLYIKLITTPGSNEPFKVVYFTTMHCLARITHTNTPDNVSFTQVRLSYRMFEHVFHVLNSEDCSCKKINTVHFVIYAYIYVLAVLHNSWNNLVTELSFPKK